MPYKNKEDYDAYKRRYYKKNKIVAEAKDNLIKKLLQEKKQT